MEDEGGSVSPKTPPRNGEYHSLNNVRTYYLRESSVRQLLFTTHEKTPQRVSAPGLPQVSQALFLPASVNERSEGRKMKDMHTPGLH